MAKSFYTDGVGNQQTLTNSQNEKIPIYDTLADAQSDLSNLQEGQIIGTKGPFSQMTLVDTVQNGNMNAVTSNAVANAGFLTSNDVVDQVTVNNMNSVSSNAVAQNTLVWTDITNQVNFTFNVNNASVTFNIKKVYMCGAFLKFDVLCDCVTSSLSEGQDLCKFTISSSLFTLPYSLCRHYNPSYYGDGMTIVGMNVYSGDNGVVTVRLTKQCANSNTISDFSFDALLPCLLS